MLNNAKRWFIVTMLMAVSIGISLAVSLLARPIHAESLAPQSVYSAHLSGMEEVPMVETMAHGEAFFVLDSDMMTIHYRITAHDLVSVTAAHIHAGAMGMTGGVVVPLDVTGLATSMYATGSFTLTATQIAEMGMGNYYLNIHTSDHPSGEVRGQIAPYVLEKMGAVLKGGDEVPSVNTMASGVALFTPLSVNTWAYEIAVNDIVSVTAGHIHSGMMGVNGPVAKPLNTTMLMPTMSTTGTVTFDTSMELLNFLTDHYYVNIHTSNHPSGEIRGQIMPTMQMPYTANLSGSNEVPPVSSGASGLGRFVLADDWATLYYRVKVSNIVSITAAHLHNGIVGQNGPVVVGLYSAEGGMSFDPMTPISGTVMLNVTQVADLFAGRHYLNVHTSRYPGGEIRGQLVPYALTPMMIMMNGEQEVPSVTTMGSGTLHLDFHNTSMVHYELSVRDIVSPTAAHIHKGLVGTNGLVIFKIYPASSHPHAGREGNAEMMLSKGMLMLGGQQLLDLITDYYYVNLRTAANPGGEIRGQLSVRQLTYLPIVSR